uniref:Uncharacterized protein n=1 Tax=Anguilla anguilla TaxID=7936 RepID=A0A0E9PQ42_ANGAN
MCQKSRESFLFQYKKASLWKAASRSITNFFLLIYFLSASFTV